MSNNISLVGRLSKDPELKKVGDHELLELNIASDVGYGERKVTNWFKCQVWGKRATVPRGSGRTGRTSRCGCSWRTPALQDNRSSDRCSLADSNPRRGSHDLLRLDRLRSVIESVRNSVWQTPTN